MNLELFVGPPVVGSAAPHRINSECFYIFIIFNLGCVSDVYS